MKRLTAFAPLLVLALIVAAAVLVLTRGGVRETVSAGAPNRAAPSFALAGLDGEMVTSDRFAGRAYVVNFFASWCTPCRAEHPRLSALRADGVVILGVAYKDDAEDAARFLRELGDPFETVALDPDGRFGLEFGVAGAVPETFVIGADGAIRAIHRGPLTEAAVRDAIVPALAGN